MNPLGFQIQRYGPAPRTMLRATWPSVLKLVQDGIPADDDLRDWRIQQPRGILIYRRVFDPGPLEQMDSRLTETIRHARPLLAFGPVAVEIPFNEEHQNGDDLEALADATVPAAEALTEEGFDVVAFITSEGNPSQIRDWQRPRVLAALRKLRLLAQRTGRRIWLGPHEYSAPPLKPVDGYHAGRYRLWWPELPEDCRLPLLIGECGIDGGVQTGQGPQRMETGWRGYTDARGYADWLRTYRDFIAKDGYVHGATVFLCGSDGPRWEKFDIGDEVDLRAPFSETVDSAARWMPPAIEEKRAMRFGLLYRMGSDIPEADPAVLARFCNDNGIAIVCPKAMDGDAWEGQFDGRAALEITNADALTGQRDFYASFGLSYHPWVVYRGFNAEAEASAHALVARLCGAVIVDFEWRYPGFADHGDWAAAVSYFAQLRAMAPDEVIVFCPDPRQIQRGEYPIADIAPYVSWSSDQTYWTDFERPWREVWLEALGTDHAGLDFCPMLPANSDPGDLAAALTEIENTSGSRGPRPIYLFQRTSLRDDNLPVLREHAALGEAHIPDSDPTEEEEMPLLNIDKDQYEKAYWGPLYRRQQEDAAMVAQLRATGHHADALLADAIEKAAGVLQPTASLHKIVCGAEAA